MSHKIGCRKVAMKYCTMVCISCSTLLQYLYCLCIQPYEVESLSSVSLAPKTICNIPPQRHARKVSSLDEEKQDASLDVSSDTVGSTFLNFNVHSQHLPFG